MNNKLAICLVAVAFMTGGLFGDILCTKHINDLVPQYNQMVKINHNMMVMHTNLTKVVFEVGNQRDKAWEELDKLRHTHDPGKLARQDLNGLIAQEELNRATVEQLEQFMSTNRFHTR